MTTNKIENDEDVIGPVSEINLVPGKDPKKVRLTTPGQVKSEIGRVYRATLRGKISPETMRLLVHGALVPALKATEIEQQFNLATDDPDDDKPTFTGLAITGPEPTPQDGAPARRLNGPDNVTVIPPEKGKNDGA